MPLSSRNKRSQNYYNAKNYRSFRCHDSQLPEVVCETQKCQSPYQPIIEMQYRHVMISVVNKPTEFIHDNSVVGLKINETVASVIVVKRILCVNCDVNLSSAFT